MISVMENKNSALLTIFKSGLKKQDNESLFYRKIFGIDK